jgi:hypothetical protein
VPAASLLCLELYQRAKVTGDCLVFELGLLAAAEAAQHTGNWHRGGCAGDVGNQVLHAPEQHDCRSGPTYLPSVID